MLSYCILPVRTAVIQGRSGRLIQRAYACLTALCLVLAVYLHTVSVCIKLSFPFLADLQTGNGDCLLLRQNGPLNHFTLLSEPLFLWELCWKRTFWIYKFLVFIQNNEWAGEVKCAAQGHLYQTHWPKWRSKLWLFLWACGRVKH